MQGKALPNVAMNAFQDLSSHQPADAAGQRDPRSSEAGLWRNRRLGQWSV